MRQDARDAVHPRGDVDRFQNFLLFVRRRIHVGRDHVRQHRGRLDRLDRRQQFLRRLRQELQDFHGLPLQENETRLDVGRGRLRLGDGNPQDARDEKRPSRQEFDDLEAFRSLTDQMMPAVGRRDVAGDIGDGPRTVQVDRQRIDGLRLSLHHDADGPLIPNGLLSRHHGARTADRDRQHDPREKHHASNRHDDQRVGRHGRQRRGRGRAGAFGRGLRELRLNHLTPPTFPVR